MKNDDYRLSEEERFEWEAAEWIVKIDRGLSAEEQDAFFQWLGEDPRNGEAFAEQRQSWNAFDLLAEWRPEHSEEPNPDLLGNLSLSLAKRRRWRAMLATAAGLAVLLTSSLIWRATTDGVGRDERLITYESSDFGYQKLEDGSEIDLNENSRVVIAYTQSERLIRLLEGEAYFTVARREDQPFVVELPNQTRFRALGTAFNVRLSKEKTVEIVVTEGKVRMEHADRPIEALEESISREQLSLDLLAGQRSVIVYRDDRPRAEVSSVNTEEIERALDWKPVVFDFSGTPLAQAVAAFNERNELQLQIADVELAALPIVASFRSNNVEGFARLLELTMGVELQREGGSRIVLRSSR